MTSTRPPKTAPSLQCLRLSSKTKISLFLALSVTFLILLTLLSTSADAKSAKSTFRKRVHSQKKINQGLGKEFGGSRKQQLLGQSVNVEDTVDEEDEEEVEEVLVDEDGNEILEEFGEDEEEYEYYEDDEVQDDPAAGGGSVLTEKDEGVENNEIKLKEDGKKNNLDSLRKSGSTTSDTDIINSLLNKGYDWRVRPPGTNLSLPGSHGPVVVSVNMLIRSVSKIDDVNMEYSVQLTFRESWVDGRLAFGLPRDDKPDFLILTAGQQIWMPDSFFQNEKQAQKHMIDKPNVLIRVHKDGQILYSVRISLVLSCPMHLHNYPLDTQTCLIDLASYAYTSDDIEYKWKETEPVQLKGGLESSLPSFQLNNVSTTYCTSKTNTGEYSCLRTVLILQRQFSYYLLQLYIPSSMLVIVSWVSFWLDRNAVPARVTLGVTTLLTITTQASGINAKLPPVSYVKAVDLWIGACMTFIFSALLEFAAVTYISSRKFYKVSAQKPSLAGNMLMSTHPMMTTPLLMPPISSPTSVSPSTNNNNHNRNDEEVWVKQRPFAPNQVMVVKSPQTMPEREPLNINRRHQKPPSTLSRCLRTLPILRYIIRHLEAADTAKKVDYLSRIMFPTCFLVFNACYWATYVKY